MRRKERGEMVRPGSPAAPAERSGAGRRFLALSSLALAFALWAAISASNGVSATASAPTGGAGCGWPITGSPNRETYNELNGISGVASNDIWAVGSSGTGNFDQETLT